MLRFLLLLSTALSAILLFVVQPLFAKFLLPQFGGTSAVWTISVFFYSAVLLLGYIYASVLLSFRRTVAFFIHGGLLITVAALLLARLPDGGLLAEYAVIQTDPALSVLLTLLAALGLPVLLLASTSVLVQRLWADVIHGDPYWLYSVSNIGSLLGLAIYPFVLEVYVSLSLQALWWVIGFGLFSILLLASWRQANRFSVLAQVEKQTLLAPLRYRWQIVLLAAIPTFLLASVTEYVSKGIASFPMLWVIPLMLYLLSFVVGFDPRKVQIGKLPLFVWTALSFVPLFFLLPVMNSHALMYWLAFLYLMVTFFLVSIYVHRRIYERRPQAKELGSFYIWVTFGGALGSGVVGFVLPVLLNQAVELLIMLTALGLYFMYLTTAWLQVYVKPVAARVTFVVVAVAFSASLLIIVIQPSLVDAERNFYGTVKVFDTEREVFGEPVSVRSIVHGATNHGFQARDERYFETPASYYGPGSGIDIAMHYAADGKASTRLAVIGLGAGMMNTYCSLASDIAYIEINPLVVDIAEKHFTYLSMCPEKTSVTIGDGRIILADWIQSGAGVFDVVMVDAFSDDAIPVHLLTAEAFAEAYQPSIDTDGVIAFHISNKYLQLRSPIIGAAESLGYEAVVVRKGSDVENGLQLSSVWVLVGNPKVIADIRQQYTLEEPVAHTYVWTDEKSSVLQALSLRGSVSK